MTQHRLKEAQPNSSWQIMVHRQDVSQTWGEASNRYGRHPSVLIGIYRVPVPTVPRSPGLAVQDSCRAFSGCDKECKPGHTKDKIMVVLSLSFVLLYFCALRAAIGAFHPLDLAAGKHDGHRIAERGILPSHGCRHVSNAAAVRRPYLRATGLGLVKLQEIPLHGRL